MGLQDLRRGGRSAIKEECKMQFHETVMGQRFFQGQLPKLIKALEKIGAELERANDLKEKELAKKQKGAG